jgi:hypothetical protein
LHEEKTPKIRPSHCCRMPLTLEIKAYLKSTTVDYYFRSVENEAKKSLIIIVLL